MRIFASFCHSFASVKRLEKLPNGLEVLLILVSLLFGVCIVQVAKGGGSGQHGRMRFTAGIDGV
jgi:hypothetical protein